MKVKFSTVIFAIQFGAIGAYGYFIYSGNDYTYKAYEVTQKQAALEHELQQTRNAQSQKPLKVTYGDNGIVSPHGYEEIIQQLKNVDPATLGSKGKVIYPSANVSQPVNEGTSNGTLAVGAGTAKPNTAPGKGNAVVDAHNFLTTSNPLEHPLGFSNLQTFDIKNGQAIYWVVGNEAYVYRSVKRQVVSKHDVYLEGDLKGRDKKGNYIYDYLGAKVTSKNNIFDISNGRPLLTLQTCYIPASAMNSDDTHNINERVLVQGEYVGKKKVSDIPDLKKQLDEEAKQQKDAANLNDDAKKNTISNPLKQYLGYLRQPELKKCLLVGLAVFLIALIVLPMIGI